MEYRRSRNKSTQLGATIVELLVGITIGLLTIAVALGAIMISRGVSGTVTDATQLQQQASYAFRIIGQQARQAGALYLNLATNKNATDPIDAADPVAFEVKSVDFNPEIHTISGIDAPTSTQYKLSIGFRNYTEPTFPSGTLNSLLRNCLSQEEAGTPTLIYSQFSLSTNNELMCGGTASPRQAIIQNVADFNVRYLRQTNAVTGTPLIQYVDATTASVDWTSIFGVEVCIVVFGTESVDMPNGSTYKDCDDNNIEMSNSGALPANRKNRLHMAFRSVYQIRSQGLTG